MEMNWNINNLREAQEDGDFTLYREMMEQLKANGVREDTATMQAFRTLAEMSWCLVEEVPNFFSKAIESIYYDLKIETLKTILGNSIFNAIYEE
jgi:hypothetical protein